MLTYSTNFANIYQNGFVFCVRRIKRLTSKTGSRWHHAKRGSVFFIKKERRKKSMVQTAFGKKKQPAEKGEKMAAFWCS